MGMENNMTFKFIELSNSYYNNYIYERLIYNIEERGRAIIMMCPRGGGGTLTQLMLIALPT